MIRLEWDGRVAHLVLDRAAKRNAITGAMWRAVPDLVADAADARALVLRAADEGAFSAGADIAEFAASARDPAWCSVNQAAIRAAMAAVRDCPAPTLALVEGDCVGGGCGLALACDLRIAGPAARFGITPAKLGLVYSLEDTKLLVDLVGPSQAKRILYTGALVGAAEAERIGLVTALAEEPDRMLDEWLHALAGASGHSQRAAKRMVARVTAGQAQDDADTLAEFDTAFIGADFQEGVEAFLGKRRPVFR